MGLKFKFTKKDKDGKKEPEKADFAGGLLSGVKGKITINTPFGKREITPDGKMKK